MPEHLARAAALWGGWGRRARVLAAVVTGLVAALGLPPFNLWYLALLGFAGMALVVRLAARDGWRSAGIYGWLAGTAYFGLAMSWLVQPFMVDAARQGWMAPFALIFMAGGLALFWGVAAALTARFGKGSPLFWALSLTLAELARGYVLTGLPWATVGHLWIGTPAMHWAAIGGPVLLSLWVLIPAALAVGSRLGLAMAALLIGVALFGGGALNRAAMPVADAAQPRLRLVQPNIPQAAKWDRGEAAANLSRLVALTAAVPAGKPPDLTIWPESSLPYLLDGSADILADAAAVAYGGKLAIGAVRTAGPRVFNTLTIVGPDGAAEQIYDKQHLVPFGEYLPFEGLLSAVGLSAFTATEGGGFSAGPGARVLDLGPGLGRILPLICYEAIFPQDLRAAQMADGRADWLLQVTNDAWFGTFSGPQQHFAQARLRAVEQGLPLVRVANTGISALIGPDGAVLDRIGLGQAGFLDVDLPQPRSATLYSRSGDAPALVLLLVALGALGLRRARNSD